VYFQHELPCDPSSLTRWRNRLDEAGAEELLAQTIEAAKTLKAIRPRELRVVSIDATVQEKNIAHPTDSRLLEVARAKLAERAAEAGINLRQSYARTGPRLNRQAGRYAHARQTKRMRRVIKRQCKHRTRKTSLGVRRKSWTTLGVVHVFIRTASGRHRALLPI